MKNQENNFEELVKNQSETDLESIKYPKANIPSNEKMDEVLGDKGKSTEYGRVKEVDPRNIVEEDNFNVRQDYDLDELKQSIKSSGVRNPVRTWYDNKNQSYVLIDGHRRFRAVMELIDEGVAIKSIPTLSETKKPSSEERNLDIIRMNTDKPLSVLEKGIVCRRLVELYGWSQKEVAEQLGYTQGRVNQLVQYGKYPKLVQKLINDGQISVYEVQKINKLDEVQDDVDKLTEHVQDAVKNKKGKKAKATDSKAFSNEKGNNESDDNNITIKNLIDKFKPVADRNDLPSNHLNFFVEALQNIIDGNDSENDMVKLVTEYASESLNEEIQKDLLGDMDDFNTI